MGDHVEVSGRMRHEACTLGQADGGATTTHTCEVAPPPRRRQGATRACSPGLGLVAADLGISPLWLCPHVLWAGAEPASGSDPGTRRSQPRQVPAGRRKEPKEEAEG